MNNRRSFLKNLCVGAAAFSILPASKTYSRIWKPRAIVPVRYEINPEWVNAPYEISYWWNGKDVRKEMGLILKRKPHEPPLDGDKGIAWPMRYTVRNGATFEQVPPFIIV